MTHVVHISIVHLINTCNSFGPNNSNNGYCSGSESINNTVKNRVKFICILLQLNYDTKIEH